MPSEEPTQREVPRSMAHDRDTLLTIALYAYYIAGRRYVYNIPEVVPTYIL